MSKSKYVPSASQTREVEAMKKKQDAEKAEKKRFSAGDCPRVKNHGKGRVYTTRGRVRYCVCDECGATWQKAGSLPGEADENSAE